MRDGRIVQIFNGSAVNCFAIQKGTATQTGRIEFIQNGIVDETDADLLSQHERHGNGNQWNASHEVISSINRIDYPCGCIGKRFICRFRFFGNKSMGEKMNKQFIENLLADAI